VGWKWLVGLRLVLSIFSLPHREVILLPVFLYLLVALMRLCMQLGDGTFAMRNAPPASDVLTGVASISAGGFHTCALLIGSGGVRCWGSNVYGQARCA
jgi:hypothetical protein